MSVEDVLKNNRDPRKWADVKRVWPELYAELYKLNGGGVLPSPNETKPYLRSQKENKMSPKQMTGGISFFANHNDPSTSGRQMGISLESADNPRDQWFCAMRFEYVDWVPQGNGRVKPVNKPDIDLEGRINYKKYLAGRRLKVTNVANGRAVIVRPADVGPGIEKRIIDVSETAIFELDAVTDNQVKVEWVDPSTPLGLIEGQASRRY
jgi:hypothetical protein